MRAKEEHIIDAIATYICVQAIANEEIISSVDTKPIINLLNANGRENEKGMYRAREILRDFTK